MIRQNGRNHTSEDPLTYMPRKPIQELPRRHLIYDRMTPPAGIYLVMLGRVKVTYSEEGPVTVSRIVTAEGLFGESALIGAENPSESAVVLDDVSVMSWTRAEIEQQIEREPRLGLALSQFLVRQCIDLQDRIESMAVYKTPERVIHALLQLAEAVGTPMADGSMRIASLTHHTISEYVGTSREIVTYEMNRLRRLGLLNYSRKFIDVHTDLMKQMIHEQGGRVASAMDPLPV
jgi:CRP-like cAMP-binding protein